MNNKIIRNAVIAFAAVALLAAWPMPQSYANHGMDKGWGGGGGHHEKSLDQKFFWKAHFLIENQDELGLSDEQVATLKKLKTDLKKDLIDQDAKIEIAKIDIMSKLYERQVDVTAVNQLIDQKYEVKNARAKRIVQAYADLKGLLTDEQYDAMKQLKKGTMQGKMQGNMQGPMQGRMQGMMNR